VFKLYDTYGFPVDLTTRMAEQLGLVVDEQGFTKKCEEAWQRSKKVTNTAALVLNANALDHLRSQLKALATADKFKYERDDITATVVALFVATPPAGEFVVSFPVGGAADGEQIVGVVTERTNFYAEQGGQVNDTGVFTLADGTELEVTNVQLFGEFVLHALIVPEGTGAGALKLGDTVTLVVDRQRRAATTSNHTATHMVNFALRQVLGPKSAQAGSLVHSDYFRFDFSHSNQLTVDEAERVEALVRDMITRDLPVTFKEVAKEVATTINGVQQMFSERYPDIVRVVSIGVSVDDLVADPLNDQWTDYSVEFCGGTHIERTSEAREFTITSCRAFETGVRRIEALTGEPAVQAVARVEKLAAQIAAAEALQNSVARDLTIRDLEAKLNDAVIPYHHKVLLRERVAKLRALALEQGKDLLRQLQQQALERADQVAKQLAAEPLPFWVEVVQGVGANAKLLSSIVTKIQELNKTVPVLLISPDQEKKQVSVVSSVLTPTSLKANDWAKHVASSCGGNGGGKPTTAQAKFTDLSKVADAEQLARDYAQANL
jgi:alanyl-tRNA synthetase